MTNQEFWNTPLAELLNQPIESNSFEQYEVLEMLCIKPYQLRFWESEFDCIRSKCTDYSSQYTTQDIKLLLRIKKYLMEDQLTVEKAKALIDSELKFINTETKDDLSDQSPKVESIAQLQEELAQDLTTYNAIESIDDSMNMNALYEEMSLETFQNVEVSQSQVQPSTQIQNDLPQKLSKAIKLLREKLKNW